MRIRQGDEPRSYSKVLTAEPYALGEIRSRPKNS